MSTKQTINDEVKANYSQSFLERLLRLLAVFTSISLTAPKKNIEKFENPEAIANILNAMVNSSIKVKILTIQIVKNLIKLGVSSQVLN